MNKKRMSYNPRDSKHQTEHPFHPKGGQPYRPMRDYESIKKELDGMDKDKRWGNSGMKGHGVNSPAMMEARKAKHSALKKRTHTGKIHTYHDASGLSKEHKRANPEKYGLDWLKNK